MRKIIVPILGLAVLVAAWYMIPARPQTRAVVSGNAVPPLIANSMVKAIEPGSGGPTDSVTPAVEGAQEAAVAPVLAGQTNSADPQPAAAAENQLTPSAVEQILALQEEKTARSATENKIDSQLLFAGKVSRGEPIAKGVKTLQVELDRDPQGRILVDIKAQVSNALLAEITNQGGSVINSFAEYQAIRAALPLERIGDLGSRDDILFISPAARAERHVGSVNSEGDVAQRVASTRITFGVTGAGVKVAVLSDSVDFLAQSQASGDLGTVTVLPGQSGVPGSGEGTAMLEIVHDLAPGAALYYASAFNGDASFANNIRQLRAAGCDIIIDDVSYYNESPFQDGIIAQAVNDVTAGGALFFSSAGNSGNKNDNQSGVWEGDFVDAGPVSAPITGQGRIHSFGGTPYNTVLSGGSSQRVDLFWADPANGAANDYDVYILNSTGTTVLSAANNTQNGTQNPYESANKLDPGQRLVVVRFSGAARYLQLSTGRGRLAINTGGQVRGHNSAVNAFCVAAVPAANATTAFTAAAKVENFSSDGLRRMFFNANGTAITPGNFTSTGGAVRQKPDIAAADGVRTTLPADSGLNPFYGTSAAAPHAGAIAALLKSYRPTITAAEVRTALTTGVLDIEAAGTDRDAGYGLIMADLVLQSVTATQPPTITGFTPSSGPLGTVVTVSGTKFNGVSAVRFNGASATFTVASSSQLTATVPAGTTTGKITVTTPDGTATSANNFTITTTPTITTFAPSSGNIGTVVTLTGSHLTGATSVTFGGVAALAFTIDSDTQIRATVPVGAVSGKLIVTAPGGSAQSSSSFTITTLPVITSFTPPSGPVGASVVIAGANFVNVTAVRFNGIAAVNPVVNSSAQITTTVPAGASTGPISVSTATGTTQSAATFTVIPAPIITGLNPSSGPAGTAVMVTGSDLTGATLVTFNGVNAASFLVLSPAQVSATAPVGVSSGPIRITTPGGIAVSPTSFTALAAPANDNLAAAQTLAGSIGSATGSNQGATKEANEPDHAGNPGGKSVWYRWTAPSAGTFAFDTAGSTFDTILAVYTGTTLNNLTVVAYNDDIVDTVTTNSRLAFVASAGTTYFIAVDGFSAAGQNPSPAVSGNVSLNWNATATIPAITFLSPSTGAAGTAVIITGANLGGTTNVAFNGVNASFAVNSATQVAATVPPGAATGPIRLYAPAGSAITTSDFNVLTIVNNDNLANALVLSGSSGRATCTSLTATKETGEPAHVGNSGGKSVWFSWTAPANGLWIFDTVGSGFDTLLALYTGNTVANLTPVTSNDDANGLQTSQVAFNAVAGTVYRIAVDGYAGAGGDVVLNWILNAAAPVITTFTPGTGGAGTSVAINGQNFNGAIGVRFNGVASTSFTIDSAAKITASVPANASTGPISITTSNGVAQSAVAFVVTGPRPVNDNFAARLPLTGAIKTVTASNRSATRETSEPNHAGNVGGDSVWWSWTAPSNGTYSVSTRGSDFDTILGIYSGTVLGTLTPVAANDDGPNLDTASLASLTATSGAVYQIAVDGYAAAAGSIVLSVYPSAPSQLIYQTGFDTAQGYNLNLLLNGQKGWQKQGSSEAGLVNDFFDNGSQQGYLGFSSTAPDVNTWLWQPLNHTPNTNTFPVVKFATEMAIVDSSDGFYDTFGWDVFNRDNRELFFLGFDNSDLGIYYQLNGPDSAYHYTGLDFKNGQIYALEITMDFGRNRWSATLDGALLVEGQPISATNNVARNLGDIDATLLPNATFQGNNYLLFDNYRVTAEKVQLPVIITPPQNQTASVGGAASFLVVVDSPLAVTYQWRFNGNALPGATLPKLDLDQLTLSQQGNYSVVVSNTAGTVTSAAASLTITQLPNLAPYQPSGWSDRIVVAATVATNAPSPAINESQDVFVSWAVLNGAGGAHISTRFYNQLYVDGNLRFTWFTDTLTAGFYAFVNGYNLGKLAPGNHTLRLVSDSTSVIAESDESDNDYSRTFFVNSTNLAPPRLSAPFRTPGGPFGFTLTGIPSRTYEIRASTNLQNWEVIATILNTNANGVLQFTDPAGASLPRRFYRGGLITP
jgi:hypothetical protein